MKDAEDGVEPLTVPVLIDDDGDESITAPETFSPLGPLVRCVYFAFDASRPRPGWTLGSISSGIPFFMLGLTGIVSSSINMINSKARLFITQDDIERTFEAIEGSELLIETGRVYLPRNFIEQMSRTHPIKRHDVMRVRHDLFEDSLRFARSQIAPSEFESRVAGYLTMSKQSKAIPPLEYSADETNAFSNWCIEQVAEARQAENVWESQGELHGQEDRSKKFF